MTLEEVKDRNKTLSSDASLTTLHKDIQWLISEVERLESIRHELATRAHDDYNAGMQAAAERSAEIAQQHSYAGAIPQAIREAFGQGEVGASNAADTKIPDNLG